MTTALTTTNGASAAAPIRSVHAFEPGSLPEALQLADVLHKSGMLPNHLRTPQAVVTAIVMGRELGLSAMQSVRGIYVVGGKPSLTADAMLAVIKSSPACEYFRLVHSDADKATYETKRKGDPSPTSLTFTVQQAKKAGLSGGNWDKYPDAMLRARCASGLGRIVYPDLLMGVYEEDELQQARSASTDPNVIDSTAEHIRTEPTLAEVEASMGGQDNQQPKGANTQAKAEDWGRTNAAFWATVREAATGQGIEAGDVDAVVHHVLADSYKVASLTELTAPKLKAFGKRLSEPGIFAAKWSEWKASLGEDDIPAFEDVTASEILGDNMADAND